MIELKDIIGWGIALIVAVIGVSSIFIFKSQKKERNNVKQNVFRGSNNYLAGGDINISKNNEE